jgi:hypothetical protein
VSIVLQVQPELHQSSLGGLADAASDRFHDGPFTRSAFQHPLAGVVREDDRPS